jgi:hypothetical protein
MLSIQETEATNLNVYHSISCSWLLYYSLALCRNQIGSSLMPQMMNQLACRHRFVLVEADALHIAFNKHYVIWNYTKKHYLQWIDDQLQFDTSNNVSIYICLELKQTKLKLLASPNPRSAGETRLQSSCSTYTNEITRQGLIRSKKLDLHISLVDEVCRIKSILCRNSLQTKKGNNYWTVCKQTSKKVSCV